MAFWHQYLAKPRCSLGVCIRDAEPDPTLSETWLSSRDPEGILEIARYCRQRRLPIGAWIVLMDSNTQGDAAFLVELAKTAPVVDVRVSPACVSEVVAGIRATRCLDVASRIWVSAYPTERIQHGATKNR